MSLSTTAWVAGGGLAVLTDIISNSVYTRVSYISSRHELLLLDLGILLLAAHALYNYLRPVFERSDNHLDHIENVILSGIDLFKLFVVFVIARFALTILSSVLFLGSARWNDIVVAVLFILTFLLVLIERPRPIVDILPTGGRV